MDFVCKCGRRQRQHTSFKFFTKKDVEAVGWRKIDNEWVCPICCNNKSALNNLKTPNDLSCIACVDGAESLKKLEKECLKDMGWYSHIIVYAPDCPYNINIHTHGLPEYFDHPDLQICAPVDPRVLHGILGIIIDKIESGREFPIDALIEVEEVISGYPFLFTWAKESGRDVLRVILSDINKNLDREIMELNEQWEGTFDKSKE